ncbi:MAG: tetratricopeptide repeat protein [Candidatus Eremiobacteraeota bacterium]|nr:tetratricopeptide repeat protein [Candidatus Eremiobacteraeota bacterium]
MLTFAAALAFTPLCALATASDDTTAIRQAREQVAGGDLNGAVTMLATFVRAHPDDAAPARLLGDLYYRQGRLKLAESAYLAILAKNPTDRETHNRLGSVYATESRIGDAIDEFNHSLPGTDAVPELVRLHEMRGDFDSYMRDRERYAQSYPSDPEANIELGKVYEAIHRPDLAVIYFHKALDNAPDSEMAINGLGLAFLDERQYASAIENFDRCIRADRYGYSCNVNLGATYLEMGDTKGADKYLKIAHSLQPEQPEALVNFGYMADLSGDWKKAIGFYVDALAVYPYSIDAYIDLGYEYEQHKLYTLAESALTKGLAVAPKEGRLHFLLGQVFTDQGKNALAIEQFKAAAQTDDPDVRRIAQQKFSSLEESAAKP